MSEPPPQPPPLEAMQPFRDWATYSKVRRDVEDMPDRRAIEAQKLASEYSKIIITNLQFINAGALLATPSLATGFLGLVGLGRNEKLLYVGMPMGLFAIGLILATLTAYFTYRNYEAIYEHWDAVRRWREADLGRLSPPLVQRSWNDDLEQASKEQTDFHLQVGRFYRLGRRIGWLSAVFFIAGCSMLAWSAR